MLADSPAVLQSVLEHTANFYKRLGLSINIGKTEVLSYSPTGTQNAVNVHIDNIPLKEVDCFKYLGSQISANCHMDDELNFRLKKATCAYGRLRKKVFENNNLALHTKVSVYNAIVLSSLLYSCETWTLYRHQLRKLENFHMQSLRRIIGVSWKDKVPNTEVLRRSKSVTLENHIHRSLLRWVGHVIRMDDTRLPKQLLYGELAHGKRSVGRPKMRYKDNILKTLKACNIPHKDLESLAAKRDVWRSKIKHHLKKRETDRLKWMNDRRQRRKASSTSSKPDKPAHICSECGRSCQSLIGLISHTKAHQRKKKKPVTKQS